jgi:hypothetical protein
MRTLTNEEVDQVSGGNLTLYTFQGLNVVGAFGTGYFIGTGINWFNSSVTGMSLGEAVYRQLH